MKSKNLYQILGLDSTATQEEIKRAFRIYASKFHPDKHHGDKFFEDKFREIKEAYDILINPETRREYDSKWSNGSGTQSKQEESKYEAKTSSTNSTTRQTYQDPIKERRNKNVIIGLGTLLAAIMVFNLGGGNGWHVPIGVFLAFWTVRQAFVIGTSYLKD